MVNRMNLCQAFDDLDETILFLSSNTEQDVFQAENLVIIFLTSDTCIMQTTTTC